MKIIKKMRAFIVFFLLVLTSCSVEGYVGYQPSFIPISITIDTDRNVTVSWESGIMTPIGRFFIGTSAIGNLGELYPEEDGVLIVNIDGNNIVYSLEGAKDISISLESGYYKQVSLLKEGENWFFKADRIIDYPIMDQILISITNTDCESRDLYIDGYMVANSLGQNASTTFGVVPGEHNVSLCLTGTNNCVISKHIWSQSINYEIEESSVCQTEDELADPEFICNRGLSVQNIVPFKPTVKPNSQITMTLTFYNPNDCNLFDVGFSLGWIDQLNGPSTFSISSIESHGFANVTLNFQAPSTVGNDYLTLYNTDLSICDGLCNAVFIYASVIE